MKQIATHLSEHRKHVMWQQRELAPDMILFNNSVNLENGKQHVNSINKNYLNWGSRKQCQGKKNNSKSTGLNPASSKISGKVSHLIGQDQVPEFLSGLKRQQKYPAQAYTK